MAPILGVALYSCLEQNKINNDRVEELVGVANCMDDISKVNTNAITSELDTQREKLLTILIFWWATMANVFLEIIIFVGLFFVPVCASRISIARRGYKCSDEFRLFVRYYLVLN